MKNSKDYLSHCKYYKGEAESPYKSDQTEDTLWFYERCWVIEAQRHSDLLRAYIKAYEKVGLKDFCYGDVTQEGYKALLFNRFTRGGIIIPIEPWSHLNPFTKSITATDLSFLSIPYSLCALLPRNERPAAPGTLALYPGSLSLLRPI